MTFPSQPLDQVCEREGARTAYRLRVEYLPGPAPFPSSPEEEAWLAERETLVVTVLGGPLGGRALVAWRRGGAEETSEAKLDPSALAAWTSEAEERGAWTLGGLAAIPVGDASVESWHEAYEYHDEDPDSLDLEAWSPPRRWSIERARKGAGDARSARRLLAHYGAFLGDTVRAKSRVAGLMNGG